ncbi:putative NTPase (NACHT family) [Leptolyngbya sp. PCC 7375]|nr:putative NTPase (NACHT family) [Leptolyngbya sp. PCC 7375]
MWDIDVWSKQFPIMRLAQGLITLLVQTDPTNQPTKTEQILTFVDKHSVLGWVFAGCIAIGAVIAALAAVTGNLRDLKENILHFLTPPRDEPSQEQLVKLRHQILLVLKRDVSKRLADSLHNQILIDLNREEQLQRVGRPQPTLVQEDHPSRSLRELISRANQTYEIFHRDDIQGRLLILGEPGAGKTTELLTLAKQLIEDAEEEVNKPIPIIFELSTWKPEQSLSEWLGFQFYEEFKISERVISQLIQEAQLLPLLDGLDKLGLPNQDLCIDAINEFLEEYPALSLVVCCRREEYEQGERQVHQLNSAIYLQPISRKQIHHYLKELNRENLWRNFGADPELGKLVQIPLFLTMLVAFYQGQPIRSPEQLFDMYIATQLRNLGDVEKTKYYLSWLARKLETTHQAEFLIERLQPSWIDDQPSRYLYRLTVGLSFGSLVGSLVGLGFGLDIGRIVAIVVGLGSALSDELGGGLSDIQTEERLRIVWPNVLSSLLGGLLFGLLILGLIFGPIFGPILGLLLSLLSGLLGGLTGDNVQRVDIDITEKIRPNQGIYQTFKNGLIGGVLIGLIFGVVLSLLFGLLFESITELRLGLLLGLIVRPSVGLSVGLSIGLLFGLLFSLLFGLADVIKHYSLRFTLYWKGNIPWNYARFLEYAHRHRFIQRVGGRYRFIHELLQKHFAQLEIN